MKPVSRFHAAPSCVIFEAYVRPCATPLTRERYDKHKWHKNAYFHSHCSVSYNLSGAHLPESAGIGMSLAAYMHYQLVQSFHPF